MLKIFEVILKPHRNLWISFSKVQKVLEVILKVHKKSLDIILKSAQTKVWSYPKSAQKIYRYHSLWSYPKSAQKTYRFVWSYPKSVQKSIDIILQSAQKSFSYLKSAQETINIIPKSA